MPQLWMKYSEELQKMPHEENKIMSIFLSLVKKEALQIMRDRRTMVITVIMPVVLLLLFGFAISTEVNDVRLAAVVEQHDETTREIIERFSVNEYISFQGLVSARDADRLLRTGKSDAVLFLKTDQGRVNAQIVVDASNTTTAQSITGYVQGILASGNKATSQVLTYTLYNPQLKSAYNFVPGILGMIFILICAIMTSVSIVREKETGTMNLLLVSPIKPSTIIIGKLVPYFILSCVILLLMLIISYTVLGLPISTSIINVVMVSLLYIVLSLSVGLLVSTLVNNQLTALIVSAVGFMLPVIMLSGIIFPIENMPQQIQWISCIIPARWYIDAMRKLMIQQVDISLIMTDICVLSGMTMALLTLSIMKFKSSK